MAEHTPGPWHLEIDDNALHVYSPVEEVLHFSDAGWDEFTRATFEANARLIAAAPDLLAALEKIQSATDAVKASLAGTTIVLSDEANEMYGAIWDARAAIAKAKGGNGDR
jgi:hypothetical protein